MRGGEEGIHTPTAPAGYRVQYIHTTSGGGPYSQKKKIINFN